MKDNVVLAVSQCGVHLTLQMKIPIGNFEYIDLTYIRQGRCYLWKGGHEVRKSVEYKTGKVCIYNKKG